MKSEDENYARIPTKPLVFSNYLMKIPIYDNYTNIVFFPSPVANEEVTFSNIYLSKTPRPISFQGVCNISLLTNQTETLQPSGSYILVPYAKGHDYVLLPAVCKLRPERVTYYNDKPDCLQNFAYSTVLNHPEVKNI